MIRESYLRSGLLLTSYQYPNPVTSLHQITTGGSVFPLLSSRHTTVWFWIAYALCLIRFWETRRMVSVQTDPQLGKSLPWGEYWKESGTRTCRVSSPSSTSRKTVHQDKLIAIVRAYAVPEKVDMAITASYKTTWGKMVPQTSLKSWLEFCRGTH